jgi:hypothetical protein
MMLAKHLRHEDEVLIVFRTIDPKLEHSFDGIPWVKAKRHGEGRNSIPDEL